MPPAEAPPTAAAALSHPAGSMMLDKSFNCVVPISIDYRNTIKAQNYQY
jgi:hypothetical protein